MNLPSVLRAAALGLLAFQSSPAVTISSILYETRPYTAGTPLTTAAGYASNWAALAALYPTAPAGYGTTMLSVWNSASNQITFSGSNSNIAFHTRINFSVGAAEAGTWDLRFGIDYGLGGALYVDGVVRDFRNTDMWWAGSYASANQILAASVALSAGAHTIELYGLEGCCDGATQGQYRMPGAAAYQNFAAAAADPLPEPSTVVLSATGLAAWLVFRRRGKA